MARLRLFCSANVTALARTFFFFAFCGGACHKRDDSAKRVTTSGPLKPCRLPGIAEELLCGKLTVMVDQRGTGESNPLTAAPRTRSPQDYLTEMYPVKYLNTLRQALEQEADLTQYATSIAMDDLDDVGSDDRFFITDFGREFLTGLVQTGSSQDKAF